MQLIGFNLTKESIERLEVKPEKQKDIKIEIKTNIDITKINKESIDISKDKEVLSLHFNFDIIYDPKVAFINFQGFVLGLCKPEESKDIQKKWKKNQIDEQIRLLIFNMILTKCNIKALQLEDEFSLPSHIPLPRFVPPQQQNQQKYTG